MFLKRLFISVLIVSSFNIFAAQREYQPKKSFAQTTKARCAADKKQYAKQVQLCARNRQLTKMQILNALMAVSLVGAHVAQCAHQFDAQSTSNAGESVDEGKLREIEICPYKQNSAQWGLTDCGIQHASSTLNAYKNDDVRNSFYRNDWHVCHGKGHGFEQCCRIVDFPELDNTKIECCRFDLTNDLKSCGKIYLNDGIDQQKFVINDWRNVNAPRTIAQELKQALNQNVDLKKYSTSRDESFLLYGKGNSLHYLKSYIPTLIRHVQDVAQPYRLQGNIEIAFIEQNESPAIHTHINGHYAIALPIPWLLESHDEHILAILSHELGHAKQVDLGPRVQYEDMWLKFKLFGLTKSLFTPMHKLAESVMASESIQRDVVNMGLSFNWETNADFLGVLVIQDPMKLARALLASIFPSNDQNVTLTNTSSCDKCIQPYSGSDYVEVFYNKNICAGRYLDDLRFTMLFYPPIQLLKKTFSTLGLNLPVKPILLSQHPPIQCRVQMLLKLDAKYKALGAQLHQNLLYAALKGEKSESVTNIATDVFQVNSITDENFGASFFRDSLVNSDDISRFEFEDLAKQFIDRGLGVKQLIQASRDAVNHKNNSFIKSSGLEIYALLIGKGYDLEDIFDWIRKTFESDNLSDLREAEILAKKFIEHNYYQSQILVMARNAIASGVNQKRRCGYEILVELLIKSDTLFCKEILAFAKDSNGAHPLRFMSYLQKCPQYNDEMSMSQIKRFLFSIDRLLWRLTHGL